MTDTPTRPIVEQLQRSMFGDAYVEELQAATNCSPCRCW